MMWIRTDENLYTISFSHSLNVHQSHHFQSEESQITSQFQVFSMNIFTVMQLES